MPLYRPARTVYACDAMKHMNLKLLGACVVCGVLTSLAAGQQTTLTPPKSSGDPEPPIIMTWLTVVLAGGAVVVAAVLPSKRGHQD